MSGTMRALVNNMVIGVSRLRKKLTLVGVGYRAQARVTPSTCLLASPTRWLTRCRQASGGNPTQTEILLWGVDKQKWVRSLPKSVLTARRNPIRARAFAMLTKWWF